ncbi:MAG: 50S ribosomal protein L5 [Thermodesulfobacteriota bacterium]
MSRLMERYRKEIIPALMKDGEYKNVMEVPKLSRIVVNMGLGDAINNIKILDRAVVELAQITGQKPVVTRARKSIASFKLRADMPIGAMVTLRKKRMYDFLDRLINITLPRVRDFKGVSPDSFDGHGNYTLGLKEQIIFPEVDYSKVEKVKGMNITLVTTARTDAQGQELLARLGMMFRR